MCALNFNHPHTHEKRYGTNLTGRNRVYTHNIGILTKWNVPLMDASEEYYVVNWTSPSITEEKLRDSFREWGKSTDDPMVTEIIDNTLEFFNKNRKA